MKAVFVIPTFKELRQIEKLITCFSLIKSQEIEFLIVNSNPRDETSAFLNSCPDARVKEIDGFSELYWSGTVNVGLNYVLNLVVKPYYVFIMNADVEFREDILDKFLQKADEMFKFQLAAVTVSGNNIVASGAKVKSWFMTMIRHPLAGDKITTLNKEELIKVDYLPTRCVIFPFSALEECGIIAEKQLPHYGGDEEFTNRLRLKGYQPYIHTGVSVFLDSSNTGSDVFYKPLSLGKRLFSLFSIKSPSNLRFRVAFVMMVYPWYAIPSGVILYVLRSFLEVVLGGNLIKRIFSGGETGFSGS